MTSGAEYPGVPLLKLLTCVQAGSMHVLIPKSVILATIPCGRVGSICKSGGEGNGNTFSNCLAYVLESLDLSSPPGARRLLLVVHLKQHILRFQVAPDYIL